MVPDVLVFKASPAPLTPKKKQQTTLKYLSKLLIKKI